MSAGKLIQCIRKARREGTLPKRFVAHDVEQACPGFCKSTYTSFLPKHRIEKCSEDTKLFTQNDDGSYSLLEE